MQNKNTDPIDLSNLTGKLKSEDIRYSNIAKKFQIVYWILIPVYSILVIRHITGGSTMNEILGAICFLLAMLTFAIIFNRFHKEYNNVDYSLPTLLMLKQAVKRYKPFQLKSFWALLAATFVDAGLVLNRPAGENIVEIQLVFLGALIFAVVVGLIIWSKRYKPLRDDALKLIDELVN